MSGTSKTVQDSPESPAGEKKKFWDFCCIINSHAAKSGDLRSSQSFFQDLGYAEVNLSVSNDNYLLPDQSWFSLSDVFLIK